MRLETATRVYLAHILAEGGDLLGAEIEARTATTTAAAGSPMLVYALAALAWIERALGRFADADEHARAAAALLATVGSIDDGDAFVRITCAEIALARGDDPVGARRAVFAAREHLLERAAKISVPAWRHSFLSRVPENARTLALAEALERSASNPPSAPPPPRAPSTLPPPTQRPSSIAESLASLPLPPRRPQLSPSWPPPPPPPPPSYPPAPPPPPSNPPRPSNTPPPPPAVPPTKPPPAR